MTRTTRSLQETYDLAREFLEKSVSLSTSLGAKNATIVALFGDLGSGKTSFVQGLARALGLKGNITSPTFVIEKIYRLGDAERQTKNFSRVGPTPSAGKGKAMKFLFAFGRAKQQEFPPHRFSHLVHIDAYRLESADELEKLGWPELASDPANLIVIEWADRVKKLLPADAVKINFKFIDEKTREISWQ